MPPRPDFLHPKPHFHADLSSFDLVKKIRSEPQNNRATAPDDTSGTTLIRGDLWGTASLNPSFGTYLLRVSPRSLLMQTGLIRALFRANIPREVGAPTASRRLSATSGSQRRRVRRPRGEPETGLNG